MNFLHCFRRFQTTGTKAQTVSSFYKDNSQAILAAATILAGVFAAGMFYSKTAAAMKVLEEKNKGEVKLLEEKNKGQLMAMEEKNKGEVKLLEEKIKTSEEKIKTSEEKIKTAKEEANKEALERLFAIINQSEYKSSKKAIQEIQIQKTDVK